MTSTSIFFRILKTSETFFFSISGVRIGYAKKRATPYVHALEYIMFQCSSKLYSLVEALKKK